jgi:hypothetical protein
MGPYIYRKKTELGVGIYPGMALSEIRTQNFLIVTIRPDIKTLRVKEVLSKTGLPFGLKNRSA